LGCDKPWQRPLVRVCTIAPVTTPDSKRLAPFIREWLDGRKLSALALAQHAGIPHTTLSALFNHGNVPRPSTLKKLAAAMGVPVGQLLVLAGHLTEQEYEQPVGETDLARLYEVGDLDTDEWEQVLDFARYVRSKRNAPE
jgi:transcriptional regulator with XRE-family HTH domain